MDPRQFFSEPRLHVVAGKGGVGKTTLTAALALTAARHGCEVLVVEVEGRGELAALFGADPLGFDDAELLAADPGTGRARIRGRSLRADAALVEYLQERGFGRLARLLVDTGVVEVITGGAPGMKDILLLGKLKQLERTQVADTILVDAPASGHAVTFLRSPRGLLDAVQSGAIHQQAAEVLDLLTDPSRCDVLLATLAEETPVNELVETAFALEEDLGIKLGPVLVNGVYPPCALPPEPAPLTAGLPADLGAALVCAAGFRTARSAQQTAEIARLAATLPLPQLRTPLQFSPRLGLSDLESLADALAESIGQLPPP